MSRWTVFGYRGVTGQCWAAGEVGKLGIKLFFTHAEALAYADRMARTYEVVLPRATHGDHVVADKGLYSLHVKYMPHCTDITLGGWDGVTVENRHLMDLAVYLAACAKHWEETQ